MYKETVQYLKEAGIQSPDIALILGSGLGDFTQRLKNQIRIPYEKIPGFQTSTVQGHSGNLIYGQLAGKSVLALQGRFHYYEGYPLEQVTYPIRIFHELAIEQLIVTNAAGGVNEDFQAGDLMLITDHLNLTGQNPLIGPNIEAHGPRFVDMTESYSKRGQALLRDLAQELEIDLKEGVYAWLTGPTYETPAEVSYVRAVGGDAVGMSTVPEVIVAKHCGMEVFGISCITNKAAGLQESLNHEDVVATSQQVKTDFENLVQGLIQAL